MLSLSRIGKINGVKSNRNCLKFIQSILVCLKLLLSLDGLKVAYYSANLVLLKGGGCLQWRGSTKQVTGTREGFKAHHKSQHHTGLEALASAPQHHTGLSTRHNQERTRTCSSSPRARYGPANKPSAQTRTIWSDVACKTREQQR
jgi:hypothetical protein